MSRNRQKKVCLLSALMAFGAMAAYAQSPGGVPVASWWRADAATTVFSDAGVTQSTDSSQLYQWNDITGHGYNFIQTVAGRRPIYSNAQTMANFNPTVTFSSDWMDYTPAAAGTKIISRANGALYASGYMNVVGNTGFFGFDASNDFPGLHTYPVSGKYDLLFFTNGGPGYQGLTDSAFQAKTYFTAGAWWQNGAGGTTAYAKAKVSLNGNRVVYSGNQIYNVDTNTAYDDMRIGWDNNWGALNGQLNELMIFEDTLTSAQMNQVETYLAIKYGSTYAYGLSDYKSSNGTVVWTAANNTGNNHNIAGVAHDNNGALYQKQSWSTNPGQQVLISTTGLANTNAANSGTLSNNQYLVWGDNGLAKYPSVVVNNIAGTNYRFASVWKVQNTGSVGTVRVAWPQNTALGALKLVQSTDSNFATGNTVTDMTGNTQVVNSLTYNYADVTLADGQYFTFAVKAYAPGGIATLPAVWYAPDNVSDNFWLDASINNLTLTNANGNGVVNAGDQAHNFNSWTTDYSNTNYYNYLDTSAANTDLEDNPVFGNYNVSGLSYTPLTIFGVARPNSTGNSSITGIDNESTTGAEPALAIKSLHPQFYRFSNGIDQTVTALTATVDQTSVFYSHPYPGSDTSSAGNLIVGLDGKEITIASQSGRSSIAGPYLKIGYSSFGFGAFQGDIQEVIWYKASLNATEKAKVDSYLGLKFGTTLAHNYVDAAGDTVYNITAADSNYRYNIAGIGREANNGNLNQRQSNSVNTGNQVLISTTGLANTNDSNTISLTNGQYLVWGDNGLAKAPSIYTGNTFSTVNVRFKAIWRVQNTGSVGTVRVAWPSGLTNLSLIQSADTTFNASDVLTDMSANTQVVNGITYNYADVTLTNGQYFTLAAKMAHAPGGVFNGLSQWFRADKQTTIVGGGDTTLATWTDYAMGVVASQISTATLPTLHTGSNTYLNFNPGVNFTATNQKIGNITVQTLSSRNYDIFSATKEGMSGTRYYNVGMDNTTLNGNNWDSPGLYASGSVASRDSNFASLGFILGGGSPALSAYMPNVFYYSFTDVSGAKRMNGASTGDDATYSKRGLPKGGFMFGANNGAGTFGDDDGFIGNIGDFILYNANLTANEKNRVDAYLAIKYGITLDTAESYLASGSTVVWDKTADLDFYHNVAGIGHDTISDLYQKQSRSQITNNANNQVTIALGDIYATNAANPGTLADGQFLMWGDNGNTVAMTNTASTYTAFTYNSSSANRRMTRVWKVRNTGVNNVVKIAFPQASVGTTAIPGETATAGYVILYSTDSTFSSGVTANRMEVLGSDYNALHNFPSGVSYFTYAKLIDTTNVPMAVGLSQFNARKDGSTALLNWATATESNNKGFDVERSIDGKQWQTLGFVASKAQEGNSALKLAYIYTDRNPVNGHNFYRLKQTDINGKYQFSPVRSVVFDEAGAISVYPNPVKNKVIISGLQGTNAITISNAIGQIVIRQSSVTSNVIEMNTAHLTAGVYIITVQDEQGTKHNFKMVRE